MALSVGVSPHVHLLYASTGAVNALYSRSRRSWDTRWCLTQRDHCVRKATAASFFLRATSCSLTDVEIPFLQATRSDSLYLVQEVAGFADEVNVAVGISVSSRRRCGKLSLRLREQMCLRLHRICPRVQDLSVRVAVCNYRLTMQRPA